MVVELQRWCYLKLEETEEGKDFVVAVVRG